MTYRYIKFSVTKRRGGGSGYIQLSEIKFIDSDGMSFSWPSGATVASSSSPTGSGETASRLIDGNTSTKYCGSTPGNVTFTIDLGENQSIDVQTYSRWQWYTANDASDRDPVSFFLALSNDGENYVEVDSVTDGSITTSRCVLAYTGDVTIPYARRYLIGDEEGKIYKIEDDALVELEDAVLSKALFMSDGFENIPDGELLITLVNPKVYLWQDSTDDPPSVHAAASQTPNPQVVVTGNIVLSHSTIVGIENVTIEADDNTLFAVSFDNGITWWNYINDSWALLSESLSGQTKDTIETISTNAWAEKVSSGGMIKFRFVLSGDGYVESITIHYLN